MCDALLERYASVINASEVVPSILFFSTPDCGGEMWPNNGSGDFPDIPSTSGSIPFQPKSIFIPFTVHHVRFTIPPSTILEYMGPFTILDTTDITTSPITAFTVLDSSDWNTNVIPSACNGNTKYIGSFPLVRYQPQSASCDAAISALCATHPESNPICGCFADVIALEDQSTIAGINLPVTCFGQRCNGIAYKTADMVSQTCNLTVCEQTITASPGIVQDGNFTIYCGGRFFQKNGQLVSPTTNSSSAPITIPPTSNSTSSWIAYAVVGVGLLLCIVLVFLIFSPKPRVAADPVVQQLRDLTKE